MPKNIRLKGETNTTAHTYFHTDHATFIFLNKVEKTYHPYELVDNDLVVYGAFKLQINTNKKWDARDTSNKQAAWEYTRKMVCSLEFKK